MEEVNFINDIEIKKIGKDKLTRKEYNLRYYETNKARIQENYKKVVECPLCESKIKHSTMNTHLKSKICKKKQEIKKIKLQILGDYNITL